MTPALPGVGVIPKRDTPAPGRVNGSETTYDNTLVTASNQLKLHSGNDTTLFGAQLAGNTVNADVGGKLAITTRQDQSQYESHQSSSGFDLSVCVPPICYGQFVSGSVNLAAQDINHDYQSATGQSGIAAGSGGFNLNVAGNTSLTGAAITSQASAEHNTLTTGSLSYQDLDNHQRTDASATSIGISAGNGSTLLSNVMSNLAANALGNAGLPKNNDESSQTKSVISPASVTITSGDAQSQAAADTLTARDASTANGALSNNLTLQQAQQLQQQLKDTQDTIKAAQIIGDIGRDITNSISQPKRDEADKILSTSSDPADRAAALAMKQQYGTGGDFQRAGQAISAAIQGLVGGDMKGAVTDAAAPYLAQVVKQMTTDADGHTNLAANAMAHAALGALLAAAKGQNTTAGAVGGGIAPITADLVMNQLYPGKTVAELSEEQKQTVAALTTLTGTLAGGLSTGNSAGAVTAGQVANNEVWNNALSVSDRKKLSAAADQCIKDPTSNQCGVAKELLKKNYDDSLENAIKNGTPLPVDLKIMTAQYFSARKASLSYSFLDENQCYTASLQAAYGIGGQVIWDSKGGWSVSPIVGQGMSGFWGVTTNHYGSPSGIQSQVSANGGALVSFGSTTGVSESGPFLQTQFGVGLGEFVGSKIQGGFSIPIKNGENK